MARCYIPQHREGCSQQVSRWCHTVDVKAGEEIKMNPTDGK